ncbi:chaperonin 10-like protein [Mycena rosella]|uniref:Chaperonin 10-like protein n=1 Tax=Mycena rosella TaxID=1033263 RepID=A0AAD7CQ21_MYCRO|nr:chaperonin 10-like protein [Mycena rosella]
MSVEFIVFKGSASDGIVRSTSRRALPTGTQVLVKITHSGICGTDEHYEHADMVLGHEGVGTVEKLGEGVKGLKVGDVVGWGYTHKTCGDCCYCLSGHDNFCTTAETYGTGNFDQGSFGSHAVWDASWLFKIPAGLAPEAAAPLMCGGGTVFSVIDTYNIRPTDRVGVMGIGGLGHLAIQFLAKMGVRVVVFSSTEAKRAEALQLGAAEFYATAGAAALDIGAPLDHLFVTTSVLPDWSIFLNAMKSMGRIYLLTASSADLVVPSLPVVTRGLTIQGSMVASRAAQIKMLDFAALHGVNPIIERFPMTKEGVDEGMARLREGRIRYRAVLVV